jgi:hypothetical protein
VVLHVYLVLGELEKGCSEILVFFFFLKFIYIYICLWDSRCIRNIIF